MTPKTPKVDPAPQDQTSPTSLPLFAARAASATQAARRPQARGLAGAAPGRPRKAAQVSRPQPSIPPVAEPIQHAAAEAGAAGVVQVDEDAIVPDYTEVQAVRKTVTEAFQARVSAGTALNADVHGDMMRDLIAGEITDYSNRIVHAGQPALSYDARQAMAQAVWDALFGAGRLQPLLDREGIENIEIEGCDNVWLQFADGRLERGPAVADTDEQLIADLQQMARMSVTGEKDFSIATKKLRMTLPDGSRLAAEAWITPRPSVTIRKHRFVDTDLDQLQSMGSINDALREFIAAAVRAGKTIVIAGDPAAGKTTLARAVLAALDPSIRIATIEAQYELLMHQMPHRHHRVWAAEAQEGGEIGADGKPIGEMSLIRLVELSLQKNVQIIVVGEVVGDEVVAMLEAMQGGRASLSTMHASSARDTVDRMVTLVTRARANVGVDYARRLIAQNVDFIVHCAYVDEHHVGGGVHRFIDQIYELTLSGNDDGDPISYTAVFDRGADGRATATGDDPECLRDLERHGFNRGWLTPTASRWPNALDLKIPMGGTPR